MSSFSNYYNRKNCCMCIGPTGCTGPTGPVGPPGATGATGPSCEFIACQQQTCSQSFDCADLSICFDISMDASANRRHGGPVPCYPVGYCFEDCEQVCC